MTTERENYRWALKKFVESASKLEDAWLQLDNEATDAVSKGYPFEKSFDELMFDVLPWYASALDGLKSVSEADGTVRYVEYSPYPHDKIKYFCVFSFDEQMNNAKLTAAEYHADDGTWFCYTVNDTCDPDKLNDQDYLDEFFSRNQNEGFSSGSYNSLKELISMESSEDDDVLLLNHFCK